MNNIITLPKLTELLSKSTSISTPTVLKFMLDFTNLIGEALATDGFVKIKGIGTFRRNMVGGKVKIEYIPEKEISDTINKPFSFFEPVELADNLSADMLDEGQEDDSTAKEETTVIESDTATTIEEPQDSDDEPKESDDELQELVEETQESVDEDPEASEEPPIIEYTEIEVAEETVADDEYESAAEYEPTESEEGGTEPGQEPSTSETTATVPEEPVVEQEAERLSIAEPMVNAPVEAAEDAPVETADEASTMTAEEAPAETADEAMVETDEEAPVETLDDSITEETMVEEERQQFPWFWISMFFILGLLIGFAVGYFCHDQISARIYNDGGNISVIVADDESDTIPSLPAEEYDPDVEIDLEESEEGLINDEPMIIDESTPDTDQPEDNATPQTNVNVAQDTPKTAAEETVYDVVRPNRYLTTMAREHYGKKEYWVYIYMENSDKISNPNNVREGTRVRIPPKKKYDVSDNEEENLAAARKKATELFNKYGTR